MLHVVEKLLGILVLVRLVMARDPMEERTWLIDASR